MVTLRTGEKEFLLRPTTRRVVELTDKLKVKNLNEVLFTSMNEGDLKLLAEVIKAFAEVEEGKLAFTSINNVYDFMDEWVSEHNDVGHEGLYKEVIEVVNEMGFFKKKMTQKELEDAMKNPISINMRELIQASAQKATDKMVEEEFLGHKG